MCVCVCVDANHVFSVISQSLSHWGIEQSYTQNRKLPPTTTSHVHEFWKFWILKFTCSMFFIPAISQSSSQWGTCPSIEWGTCPSILYTDPASEQQYRNNKHGKSHSTTTSQVDDFWKLWNPKFTCSRCFYFSHHALLEPVGYLSTHHTHRPTLTATT